MANLKYPDTAEGAMQVIKDLAETQAVQAIDNLVRSGQYRWIPDPKVEYVWGLSNTSTSEVILVVYCADSDFEYGDQLEELIDSHS